jgi:hypothetical protein
MLNYFEANIMELRDLGRKGMERELWELWRLILNCRDLKRFMEICGE